jgi:hypothetical protein
MNLKNETFPSLKRTGGDPKCPTTAKVDNLEWYF